MRMIFEMNWFPIDTAPKDGTNVLLYFPPYREEYDEEEYAIGAWVMYGTLTWQAYDWVCTDYSIKRGEPTNWAPLEPPTTIQTVG